LLRKTVSGIILTAAFIGTLTLAFNLRLSGAQPATIVVPDDYRTIQDAINAAKSGDTVFVRSGIYVESLTVNKAIAIIGEGCETTILDASGYDGIMVFADGVTLRGFTIKNADCGVYLESNDNTVTKNIIVNSSYHSIMVVGYKNGGYRNNISWNKIISTEARWGIWIIGGGMNNVVGNIIANHKGHGIYISPTRTIPVSEPSRSNIIFNNTIIHNGMGYDECGIYVENSPNNIIFGNTIIGNKETGITIVLGESKNNTIFANIIANHECGISIGSGSDNHTLFENKIINNKRGICIGGKNCRIFHNNFINNTIHATASEGANIWNDYYPSGGNYWSDYDGIDVKTGANQNQPGSDGIGDTPYIIDAKNRDMYPLIVPWGAIPVIVDGMIYSIGLKSNSTVHGFEFNQPLMQISFKISGEAGMHGYCNVTVPKTLLKGEPWTVKLNGTNWNFQSFENETHSFIYFTYTHASTYHVVIQGTWVVPEFPSTTILPILMLATLIATIVLKKRRKPKTQLAQFFALFSLPPF